MMGACTKIHLRYKTISDISETKQARANIATECL